MRFVLNSVLALMFCVCAYAQPDFTEVDRILQDSLVQLGGTTATDGGGVALVIWKLDASGNDGAVVFDKSYALPGKTYSSNKLVSIASATKGLSGLVIMGMVDDGILSLDDKLGDLIADVESSKRDI